MKKLPLDVFSRDVKIRGADEETYTKITELIKGVGGAIDEDNSPMSIYYIVPDDVDLTEIDVQISNFSTPKHALIEDWEGIENHPPEEDRIVASFAEIGYKYTPGYLSLNISY